MSIQGRHTDERTKIAAAVLIGTAAAGVALMLLQINHRMDAWPTALMVFGIVAAALVVF